MCIRDRAKPQTVPSNYRSSILGMLIHWRDEPAVDRSFRLAVATSGVRAVSMPEDRRIVQSVEPLFYEGRLIGVLIYERPALAAEEPPPAGEREAEQASGALDWAAVSPCLDDAVLFLDEEDVYKRQHLPQRGPDLLHPLLPALPQPVDGHGLQQTVPDAHGGVQGGLRILEDDLHPPVVRPAPLPVQACDVLPLEADAPPGGLEDAGDHAGEMCIRDRWRPAGRPG